MKYPLILLSALFLFTACDPCKQDGAYTQHWYTPGVFESVSASGDYKLYIMPGTENQVWAEGDKALVDNLSLKVVGTVLQIGMKEDCTAGDSLLSVYVAAPEWYSITSAGRVRTYSTDLIRSDRLLIHHTSSDSMKMAVVSERLGTWLGGSGYFVLGGFARQHEAVLEGTTGGGTLDARELRTWTTIVDAPGNKATAYVQADTSMRIVVKGAQNIVYYGGTPEQTDLQPIATDAQIIRGF